MSDPNDDDYRGYYGQDNHNYSGYYSQDRQDHDYSGYYAQDTQADDDDDSSWRYQGQSANQYQSQHPGVSDAQIYEAAEEERLRRQGAQVTTQGGYDQHPANTVREVQSLQDPRGGDAGGVGSSIVSQANDALEKGASASAGAGASMGLSTLTDNAYKQQSMRAMGHGFRDNAKKMADHRSQYGESHMDRSSRGQTDTTAGAWCQNHPTQLRGRKDRDGHYGWWCDDCDNWSSP